MHESPGAHHVAPEGLPDRLWPRQTPSTGALVVDTAMRDIPASFGVQGPGETSTPSAPYAAIPAASIASFFTTCDVAPSSPRYWTRLKVNES